MQIRDIFHLETHGESSVDRSIRSQVYVAFAALTFIALLQLYLLFTRSINWDELYYLGQIYKFQSGQPIPPLQTLHTNLFGWLTAQQVLGIDQIIVGRVVMFACEMTTAACIGWIANKFVSWPHALIAAAAYLCAGFVVQHGWSFRTDPLVTMLTMVPLALLARSKLSAASIAIFGVLLGAAGMVSMKAILFGPAFAGLAWLRLSEDRFALGTTLRVAALPILSAAMFGLIYWAHSSSIFDASMSENLVSGGRSSASESGINYATGAGSAMFFVGIPEYTLYVIKAAALSMPLVIMIAVALKALLRENFAKKIALIGLLSPILTIAYYHNTLPYYYAFMLAPVAAAASVALPIIAARYHFVGVAGLMVVNATAIWAIDGESRLDEQRAIQQAANEILAQPVPYIDFPHMLPNFPKANGFMTHWGMEAYLSGAGPSIIELAELNQAPLILTVDPVFDPTLLAVLEGGDRKEKFRSEDQEKLPATFRKFHGPFWVAGVEVAPGQERKYEVIIAGTYTIAGDGVRIDGAEIADDTTVDLQKGVISIENFGQDIATLTWGERLKVPTDPAPTRPYWTDF